MSGILTRANGDAFNLADVKTFTIQNGGDGLFGSGDLDFNGGNVTVNAVRTTLHGTFGAILTISGGSTVAAQAGTSFSTTNSASFAHQPAI